MQMKTRRVERLKALLEKLGGAAEVEHRYENINASYLSQLINGHCSFGEKAARNLEKKLNLRDLYLDQDETYDANNSDNVHLTPELIAHLKVMQQLPDYARTEVIRDAIKTVELISKAQAATKGNGTQ